MKICTASAIDLAGSEDNRRTENGKERLVESASINKSLFVLAKCVEAISEKQARIPYRESKMTRILSLGQNNGLTLMILNLAPVRSYHLDTLSSLNFANRTKKIEVREIENEPLLKGCPRALPAITGAAMRREPLRPLATTSHSTGINTSNASGKQDRPSKAFSVYSDKARPSAASVRTFRTEPGRCSSPHKRPLDSCLLDATRPPKRRSPVRKSKIQTVMSKEAIENIIERKVNDILAARALDQPSTVPMTEISEEVQRRLDQLEQRIEGKDEGREQGLTFLLMAKQHSVRGEHTSALKMYSMAKEYFPNNAKLETKIDRLRKLVQEKLQEKRQNNDGIGKEYKSWALVPHVQKQGDCQLGEVPQSEDAKPQDDEEYQDAYEPVGDGEYETADQSESKPNKHWRLPLAKAVVPAFNDVCETIEAQTPRTRHLLAIVNTQDVRQIRLLKGVGAKKAAAIFEGLCGSDDDIRQGRRRVQSLGQLASLKGVGAKMVENMRLGLGIRGIC